MPEDIIFNKLFRSYLHEIGIKPSSELNEHALPLVNQDTVPRNQITTSIQENPTNSEITLNESNNSDSDESSSASNEKPKFKCNFINCGKMFMRKEHLTRHMRVHTRQRPFSCTVDGCNKQFSRSDNRDAHVKNVHYKKSV